jgi:hypothetical protein
MPWIYNEDMALKFKLQGLQVIDANAPQGRSVKVRYRLPEDELAALSYPIIIIEHLPTSFAPERQTRKLDMRLPYAPEGQPIWWPANKDTFDPNQSPYITNWPLAVNLDYRITVYCRKMVEHLQPLMTQLALQPYLPFQFGYLNIPQDGTWRNMFLMEGPTIEYGKDQNNKNLFRASYMVRVMSEVIQHFSINGTFNSIVTDINLDLGVYLDVTDLTTEEFASNKSLIATGPTIGFNVGIAGTNQPMGQTEPEAASFISHRRPRRRGIT